MAIAIVGATITLMGLFVFFLVPGLMSLLFRELILTIAIAVGVSLIIGLTVTPMLCKLLCPNSMIQSLETSRMEEKSKKVLQRLLSLYHTSVCWSMLSRRIAIGRRRLSLIGLSLALYLTGTLVGVTVMIGIVALAGVEIHHGVVLLTLVNQLREEGLQPLDAVIKAGAARLRPILMTLLVGVVGLLPLALGIGEGTETLQPMAIGVIGGLLFSLLLTLFFLPALCVSIFGIKSKELSIAAIGRIDATPLDLG